ncbi:hypothetical protein niasHS_016020 [Heterodera schachtii]|uniref:Uncharacterized protein n=1 Tax=Heterodera schachtii TaxID=97005 RepID=A0ABD2HNI5_HETSC
MKKQFNRVANKNGNSCFICLQDGHTKGRCSNTKLVAEFQKFKRHSDSKGRWTDMVYTSDQGSCISHTQRKFVRPNLRMVLTDFMLNNCDRAAAQQHRWDNVAEVTQRMRLDNKFVVVDVKPKKEPPIAGYDFVPAKKAEEIYKHHGLTQVLLCIGRKIPLLYRCDEETGIAALHLTHRPVLHGPLVPTGEPPLSTYKYK